MGGLFKQKDIFLDSIKSSPKVVKETLNSIQYEDFDIHSLQRKKDWGTGISLTGLGTGIATFTYLFTNEITPTNIKPLIWGTLRSEILLIAERALKSDSQKRITKTIDGFNSYYYSGNSSKFLRLDIKDQFLGQKIDIYEGTKLLQRDQVSSL